MKISINYIIGVILLGFFSQAAAQQIPVMNHYIYNPYLYNPARAGQENALANTTMPVNCLWLHRSSFGRVPNSTTPNILPNYCK